MNFALVSGFEITFSPVEATDLGSEPIIYHVDDFYHPFGYLIRVSGSYGSMIDSLTGKIKCREQSGPFTGLLITHDERVLGVRASRLGRMVLAPGHRTFVGDDRVMWDPAMMALELCKGDGMEAVRLLAKTFRFRYVDYTKIDVREIAKRLVEKGFTEALPDVILPLPPRSEVLPPLTGEVVRDAVSDLRPA